MLIPKGTLPGHGREKCSRCFDKSAIWGITKRQFDGWNLINNPMSWGSKDPINLILGFSKGSRQAENLESRPHDTVAFSGFREKLQNALTILGLLSDDARLDDLIRGEEQDWAFGSLARCTVEKFNAATGKFMTSGDVISTAAKTPSLDWFRNCADAHLRIFPPRLRNIILLSNDDAYVEACFQLIRRLHPTTRRLNSVAYQTGKVRWVHIVHVGGPGINHINNWLAGAPGKQGDKMRLARAALREAE